MAVLGYLSFTLFVVIPTLIIFKAGQATSTKVGSVPKNQLSEWIESSI